MLMKRLLIASAAFALAFGLVKLDGRMIERREARRLASGRLLPWKAEETQTVVLNHMDAELELRREGKEWRVVRPIQTGAEPAAVAALVDLLDKQTRDQTTPASDDDLKRDGLANPPLRARLVGPKPAQGEAPELKLLVGVDTPVAGQVYARAEGEKGFFTVAAALRDRFNDGLLAWRDKRLVTTDLTKARSVTLMAEGQTVEARRAGNGWRLAKPVDAPADKEAVEDVLREIQAARALDVLTTDTLDLTRLGLAAPAAIAVVDAGPEGHPDPATLMIGYRRLHDAKPSYYAARKGDPRIFLVGQSLVDKLQMTEADLRAKDILELPREEAAMVSVMFGDNLTTLTRDEQGAWKLVGDDAARVDQEMMKALLQKTFRMRVAEYLKVQLVGEDPGLDPPTVRVVVADKTGHRREGFETGRPVVGRKLVYARRLGQPEVFMIELDKPGDFFLKRVAFLDKTLFTFAEESVARVRVEEGGKALLLEKGKEGWTMGVEGGQSRFQTRNNLVDRFLGSSLALRWTERLDAARPGDFELDPPKGTITYFDADGKTLGALGHGGQDRTRIFVKVGADLFAVDKQVYAAMVGALNSMMKAQ